MTIDKYLYEIIDDYKKADSEEEKNAIFKSFCSFIWASDNKRRIYSKTIRYTIRKDLLNTDVGQVFHAWSEITYTGYKSRTKDTDWCSLIRQKVNNLYTRYFDKEVILRNDYMDLLKTPKKLYYQWLDGMALEPDNLTIMIHDALSAAEELKAVYQKQKMELSWNHFKNVMEEFFRKIFTNCQLLEDYEDTQTINIYDFINEDNFYIGYFCKYLEAEMKQWQKKYYGVRNHKKYKRCKLCGSLIETTGNKRMYCVDCAKTNETRNATLRKRKQRQNDMSRNRKT